MRSTSGRVIHVFVFILIHLVVWGGLSRHRVHVQVTGQLVGGSCLLPLVGPGDGAQPVSWRRGPCPAEPLDGDRIANIRPYSQPLPSLCKICSYVMYVVFSPDVCLYHVCSVCGGQKRALNPLGLELQETEPGMELRSSGWEARALNCWSVSLAPCSFVLPKEYHSMCQLLV